MDTRMTQIIMFIWCFYTHKKIIIILENLFVCVCDAFFMIIQIKHYVINTTKQKMNFLTQFINPYEK